MPFTLVETCVLSESESPSRANPKSATLARMLSVRRIFDDFTSLWIICFSVANKNRIASNPNDHGQIKIDQGPKRYTSPNLIVTLNPGLQEWIIET